jgi:hypothetical protein
MVTGRLGHFSASAELVPLTSEAAKQSATVRMGNILNWRA